MAIRRRLTTAFDSLPAAALPGVASIWSLQHGEHPSLARALTAFHRLNPLADNLAAANLTTQGLPYAPARNGHHVMVDQTYLAAAGTKAAPQEDSWPLAPLYVRDLAGRIIHTGLNPLPVVPEEPLFPVTCADIPTDAPDANLLERVFLTSFRRLELACQPGVELTGRPDTVIHTAYVAPHRYPYKLRVDSFYTDGFRLPQVERLFVKDAPLSQAENVGQTMLATWEVRPRTDGVQQDYETFHEAQGGAAWTEQMFLQGCTLVPTLEGFNGYYQVNPDFTMADVWPGCAVEGLHEVVEIRPDESPAGTILEVRRPGYATRAKIVPAQVVVSDGSRYRTPHTTDPEPLWPDERLPHPRLAPDAEVWVPTHPSHFEVPVLWDWNADGHFLQVAGPLWDPLHYVYASTARIIRAFRHGWEENPDLAQVPDDMVGRFHPVIALTTYDTVSTFTADVRRKQRIITPLFASALDAVPLMRTIAPVGYHPLPAALEYELDPFVFPQLSPRHRPEFTPKGPLAPVITSNVTVAEAQKLLAVHPEPARQYFLQPQFWPETVGHPDEDYPDLTRVVPASKLPEANTPLAKSLTWCMLPDVSTADLMVNVKRFFASKAHRDALDALGETIYPALFTFREEALSWRRLRHRVARKYAGWYLWLWWHQHSPSHVHEGVRDNPEQGLLTAEMLLVSQPGAVVGHLPVPKGAPAAKGSKPADGWRKPGTSATLSPENKAKLS